MRAEPRDLVWAVTEGKSLRKHPGDGSDVRRGSAYKLPILQEIVDVHERFLAIHVAADKWDK